MEMAFLGMVGYIFYIQIVTFFENRRNDQINREYFKNRA
jgi:hypothetical protein